MTTERALKKLRRLAPSSPARLTATPVTRLKMTRPRMLVEEVQDEPIFQVRGSEGSRVAPVLASTEGVLPG